jgi:replicative DNA helicase
VLLYIEPTSDLSIDAIRTRARRMKRQYGIGLLIIDYLRLLRGTDSLQARQNRTIEVWENRLREVANIAEIIIAKQRMGPIGVEKLAFNTELTQFTDLCGSLPPRAAVQVPSRHRDSQRSRRVLYCSPPSEDANALKFPRLMAG